MPPEGPVPAGPGVLSWRQLFDHAASRLGDRQVARWLVEDASGGYWPGVLDEAVPLQAGNVFASMLERRLLGEPVQYVLGHWSFRQLDLMVNRHVLIPRPETEVVVEVALSELDRLGRLGRRHPRVADLGTGSGAIALSIACERPSAEVWATDISPAALSVASANLAGLGNQAAQRAHLRRGSWWEALPAEMAGSFDLVVSNPPYIAHGELASLAAEVKEYEPLTALVAGPDGLEAVRALLEGCSGWLAPEAALVVEIAPHQAGPAQDMARRAGLESVQVHRDLAGRERALVGRAAAR